MNIYVYFLTIIFVNLTEKARNSQQNFGLFIIWITPVDTPGEIRFYCPDVDVINVFRLEVETPEEI